MPNFLNLQVRQSVVIAMLSQLPDLERLNLLCINNFTNANLIAISSRLLSLQHLTVKPPLLHSASTTISLSLV